LFQHFRNLWHLLITFGIRVPVQMLVTVGVVCGPGSIG